LGWIVIAPFELSSTVPRGKISLIFAFTASLSGFEVEDEEDEEKGEEVDVARLFDVFELEPDGVVIVNPSLLFLMYEACDFK
jgi:hypothetical protein